jgi:hypothetical protein
MELKLKTLVILPSLLGASFPPNDNTKSPKQYADDACYHEDEQSTHKAQHKKPNTALESIPK